MSGHPGSEAPRKDSILAWLRQREDEMAALLSELVAIATENPPGRNYQACAALLEKRLRNFGLDCERFFEPAGPEKKSGESPACLLACYGRGKRTLYFHGHYDVVPAQSAQQFEPVRKEHFLFGRGSCDMKGGIVAMLYAILALKGCGAGLSGKAGLMLVPNEETGGAGGSAWLAQQGLLGRNGIGMLLAEPTSGVVWNANRGAISLRVQVFGKSAHVGLQHQGENAFERMHLEWEILQEGSSAACREDNPLGKVLAGNVKAVTGQAPRFEMCPGLLETRFYAAREIPGYAYGPGLLSVAHGPNEHVDLRKMIDCATIYALTAVDILGR